MYDIVVTVESALKQTIVLNGKNVTVKQAYYVSALSATYPACHINSDGGKMSHYWFYFTNFHGTLKYSCTFCLSVQNEIDVHLYVEEA